MKQEILKEVDLLQETFESTCRFIWNHPELGGFEKESADYYRHVLSNEGFTIHNDENMEHAFYGEYGSGKPVIAILGEYDALPNLSQKVSTKKEPICENGPGHGCGHNLLGSAAVTSAIAVKRYMEKNTVTGTLRFYGCPQEELLNGKVKMMKHHMFDGCDVALAWHPMSVNAAYEAGYLASVSVKFRFKGITSHAAVAPEQGRSALDAVELMNVGVNYLREHVIDSARIHYTTDSGNFPPNVVPDDAGSWYFIRAPHMKDVLSILERIQKIAQGAALMTETTVTDTVEYGCWEMQPAKSLTDLAYQNLLEAPMPKYTLDEENFVKELQATLNPSSVDAITSITKEKEKAMHTSVGDRDFWQRIPLTASTDTGDVSFNMPMCTFTTACWPQGVNPHTWQASSCAGSSVGEKGAFYAAHVLAGMAFDILNHPDYLETYWKEFKANNSDYEVILYEE